MTKSTFINQMAIKLTKFATESESDAKKYWEDMNVQKRIGHLASLYGKGVAQAIEENHLNENQAELVYLLYLDEFHASWMFLLDESDGTILDEIDDFITNCVLFRIREMAIEY